MRAWLLCVAAVSLGCQPSRAERRLTGSDGALHRASEPATDTAEPSKPAAREIAALATEIYIRSAPRAGSPEIGVLHFGTSIRRSAQPIAGSDCPDGWYAVEPEGYVCHGRTTTLEPDTHPLVRAARRFRGDFSSALPYRWFESPGDAPLLRKLPQPLENSELPEFLRTGGVSPWSLVHTPGDRRPRVKLIGARSTIAATHEFSASGEPELLTSELLVVPRLSVREQRASSFRGVHFEADGVKLPIAFVRFADQPRFRPRERELVPASVQSARASFEPTGETFPRLGWLKLTGRSELARGTRYLETASGDWIRERDATPIQPEPPRGFELAPGERWIDVSIFRGTLVAYEGEKPVFATLISPGQHGYRRVGGKPDRYTTPTGTFRLEWKHLSTDMTPDPERPGYALAEVPWTQFFHMPFALHAAYWHDRFGEPKSGGCVNLSPEDAKWLFEWTSPRLPAGWHGVRSGGSRGPGTWVRIR